jgi:AGCS family alanine or glycine:cation symporter
MIALIFGGGITGIEALINYVDFALFLTIFFNLIGVYYRYGDVVALTKEYFANPKKWETTLWPMWVEMDKNRK